MCQVPCKILGYKDTMAYTVPNFNHYSVIRERGQKKTFSINYYLES